jgi:spermidine/putrescine transport system permease protein
MDTTAPAEGFSLARLKARTGDGFLMTLAGSVLAFLYLPIVVLIVFSFNDSRSLTLPLSGFTWHWYQEMASNGDLLTSIWNSFYVGFIATALTLAIGVPAAFALDRLEFPGKRLFRRLVLLPLVLPGLITGIAMLNMFRLMGLNLSLETVILGHATALVSVVATQVFARLQRLNRSIEEASADLGAKPWETFVYVIFPNIRSSVIGSALIAFTLSFDEVPVTYFLTGRDNTLPMYIWSTLRRGITPEINAVGTLIVVGSLVLIAFSVWLLSEPEQR